MKRSARQVLALVLVVFVTVGVSLSAVQASDMSVKMAMASDMSASAHGMCQGCPTGGEDEEAMASCPPACVPPFIALLPPAVSVAVAPASRPQLSAHLLPNGQAAWPDPHPPRPSDIG